MKAIDPETSVSVVSAVGLTAQEKKEVERIVSGTRSASLVFSYRVDPDVLGGVKVEVGDLVIDSTIASQLKKVQVSLEK
jgi:F-type H+-transporting ATPase subunit delta